MKTLEQRVKFDHHLPIGESLVQFTLEGKTHLALVNIGPRGKVMCLPMPKPEDMYTSWWSIRGDMSRSIGSIIVWASQNADLMAKFNGEPLATVALERKSTVSETV